VSHFGKGVHWDGAKDDDAIFVIVGMGPGLATQVPPTKGKFSGLDPAAVGYRTADQFKWRDPSDTAPTNQTILQGNPSKPGVYVQINKFKPNTGSRPHFHPNDRFIFVLKGTWWVGTGTKYDPGSMVAMPAGTFVTHFGKKVHYDGARADEVSILIVGEGPATRTAAEQN
jgi:quercetin dioxygenase-like cupin family protein